MRVRETIVEGIFYPSDIKKLTRLVKSLLHKAPRASRPARGIISPHAGLRYSGSIAAAAFNSAAAGKFRRVVIVAPAHHHSGDNVIFPESDYFKLPTGLIPVDREAVESLAASSTAFHINDLPHLDEHSIEVQLPFTSTLFPKATIIPILLGTIGVRTLETLADALRHTFSTDMAGTLFVASANLTPFLQKADADAQAELFLSRILQNEPGPLRSDLAAGRISSGGAASAAVLLTIMGQAAKVQLLARGSSAETNADYLQLVHYAAVAFF